MAREAGARKVLGVQLAARVDFDGVDAHLASDCGGLGDGESQA